jgi:hypothetical protein
MSVNMSARGSAEMRVDVHQHVWTGPLLDRLAVRQSLPLVRRTNGLTVLHSAAEPPYVIELATEAPEQRAALVRRDGLDLALVAISSEAQLLYGSDRPVIGPSTTGRDAPTRQQRVPVRTDKRSAP